MCKTLSITNGAVLIILVNGCSALITQTGGPVGCDAPFYLYGGANKFSPRDL